MQKYHHHLVILVTTLLISSVPLFNSTNENETDSASHSVPPVVGPGISKLDTAIGLKNYGSTPVPSPSDVPTKKENSCNVAGKNNVPTENLEGSTGTPNGQDKVPSKQNATDSR